MADIDPREYTVAELRDELESIHDPDDLEAVREAEADGENRTSAIDAIDERLESVSDDGDGADADGESDDTSGNAGSDVGIVEVRNGVREAAADLIGRPLDSIVEIEPDDDGWHALVEIIERRSVPDTQDILGRYALSLDDDAGITGYRRLERYRRGDTRTDEEPSRAL